MIFSSISSFFLFDSNLPLPPTHHPHSHMKEKAIFHNIMLDRGGLSYSAIFVGHTSHFVGVSFTLISLLFYMRPTDKRFKEVSNLNVCLTKHFLNWFFVCGSIPECELLLQSLEELAKRYPATKFVKIISTDCIPNYPDCNLPTILVYNNSAVKGTYVGLHHFGSRKCTPEGKL